jgi:hypothetical protein
MKLGDDLMRVPRLEVSGSNWVIYKDRFCWAIDARGLLEHVDGSGREPTRPTLGGKKAGGSSKDGESTGEGFEMVEELTAEDERRLEVWKGKLRVWKHGEAVVKQQIAATIPDSLFMKIRTKGTAREIWEALMRDFQNKSRMVSVDLRRRLQQQHCVEKGDIRSHFDTLRTMREDLASMGHSPSEDDFYAIVIGSLPPSYDPYISAVNATSSVLGSYLSSDDLMQTITDEYERRNLGRPSKREENAAFHMEDDGQRGRSALTCFNCQKKGHKKVDCWAEGGGKAGQGPWGRGQGRSEENGDGEDRRNGKESAASAREPDAAWAAVLDESDFEDSSSLTSGLDTCPSLDELLKGLTDDEDDLDIGSVSWEEEDTWEESIPSIRDKIEPDFTVTESVRETMWFMPDEIVEEGMPLEGKIEDLDVPEELQASVNPVTTENEGQQTPTPIPEATIEGVTNVMPQQLAPPAEAVEEVDRRGKRIHEDENAIAMPLNMQMATEKSGEDFEMEKSAWEVEDQAMALWLSDPEDDDEDVERRDWATMMDEADARNGNVPVEGNERVDERVDDEGNQPIPLAAKTEDIDWPTTPQLEDDPNEKLLSAQPKEQGKCGGKAASTSSESDEGVDKADWRMTITTKEREDQESPYERAGNKFDQPKQQETANAGLPDLEKHGTKGVDDSWGDPRKNVLQKREGPRRAQDAQDRHEITCSKGDDDDEWAAVTTGDRESFREVAKGEVKWPEDAGVELHASYPKAELGWECHSDPVWNLRTVDEIEGESGGKAASRDGEDEGRPPDVPYLGLPNEDDPWRDPRKNALQISSDKSRGRGGEREGVSWINPRKHKKGRRVVNPETAERREVNSEEEERRVVNPRPQDDAKSILSGKMAVGPDEGSMDGIEGKVNERNKGTDLKPYRWSPATKTERDLANRTAFPSQHAQADPNRTQCDFHGAELGSTPINLDEPLSRVQKHSYRADVAKTDHIPYFGANGTPTHTSTGTNENAAVISAIVAEILEKPGVTHSKAIERDSRDLKREGEERLASGGEENGMQDLPDAGEASQCNRRVGYKPMTSEESSLDQPKGTRNKLPKEEAEAEAEAEEEELGAIHAANARHPFWETFPPPEINKPPSADALTKGSRPKART